MKNNATKIIVLALSAILLIACCFGIGVMAEDAESPKVEILFNNLEYGDNIAILYAVNVEGAEEYALKLNFYTEDENGEYVFDHSTSAYELENVKVNGVEAQYPVFKSAGIAPKHMTEIVYAQAVLTVGDAEYKSNLSRFSITEYCYKRLYKDTNATDDQKALYNHVLGFGTYAQKVLGYDVENTPANYFYVNAEGAVVDSVTINDTKYDFSAGIFKAGEKIGLTYAKALGIAEFAEWSVSYKDTEGATTETADDKSVVTVEDKHVIAVPTVKLISEDFDNGTTSVITNSTTNESLVSFSVVDSPDAAYTGDKALMVGKTASKTSSVATTTIPLMNTEEGNCYILSFDFYYTKPPHTGSFATLKTNSSGTNLFSNAYSYMNNDGVYAMYTMYSNGNGNAGHRYLYSGNSNTTGEWVNIRYEYYLLDGGIWTARFYLDDVFISDNTLTKNSTKTLTDVTITHHDIGNSVYYDNISFVRCDKAYTADPETAAPDFEGTRGEGTYYNNATDADFTLDFDIDYTKNGNGMTQTAAGPCITTGVDVADAYNANGFAYAYRTEGGATHAGIQLLTRANSEGYDKTIVELDIAISKPETSWPVTITVGNGTYTGDFYIGYNANTGKLCARDTKLGFDVDKWNNIRIEIDNTSFNTTTKTASAEVFINGVSAGNTVLYDVKTSSKNYINIGLRANNNDLVICYDNLFVGYRASDVE